MTYYSQRKSIKNGEAQAVNNRYGERNEMERQFHLYCASACTNSDNNELDAIEWGTLEQGAIERKVYHNYSPEPVSNEPESEDEPSG